MTLIFYDLETSGVAKGFDQVLQFAAVRTDDDLQVIGEAFEIRSRLLPHVIPSPAALQVTGMGIEQLLDASRPSHYEMVGRIREVLGSWCPGVFVGYNSLRFDEEFLRQAFYQCLHPPYLTNTGGSGRADALRLVRALVLLDPDALVTPTGENGKPSFKLDRLAPANGLAHDNAHDALADVEAMVGLCRVARDRQPVLWDRFLAFGHKAEVFDFLAEHRAFVMIETAVSRPAANPVVRLGAHPAQNTLVYGLDLRCDIEDLKALDDEAFASRLRRTPRPIRRIKANAGPILLSLEETPARLLGGLTAAEARARADLVLGDPAFVARMLAATQAAETVYEPSPYVEEQLYGGGFWSRADERLMAEFHRVPWERRSELSAAFEDRRLRVLAKRLVYFERPDLLSAEERRRLELAIAQRTLAETEDERPWLTAPRALQAVEEMLSGELAEAPRRLLQGYRDHLRQRLERIVPA